MLFTNITKTFFFLWLLISLIFYALYFLYNKNIINKIPYNIKIVFSTFAIIGLIVLFISFSEVIIHYNEKPKKDLDYIIVLGALVLDNGPALSTIYRLDEAIKYLNENQQTRCIVSGGKGDNEPDTEANIMSKYMIEEGIEIDRLILEDEATSTLENLAFSEKFLDKNINEVGIVTNNFHVSRAIYLAKKLGYKNVCGIPSYSLPINALSNCLRESIAMIYYKLKLNLLY